MIRNIAELLHEVKFLLLINNLKVEEFFCIMEIDGEVRVELKNSNWWRKMPQNSISSTDEENFTRKIIFQLSPVSWSAQKQRTANSVKFWNTHNEPIFFLHFQKQQQQERRKIFSIPDKTYRSIRLVSCGVYRLIYLRVEERTFSISRHEKRKASASEKMNFLFYHDLPQR